jgi:putative NIF3 family GTP cyclohydrolase 1 type 2
VPTVQDLTQLLEAAAPLAYQESYDNAGLQCGLPSAEITGVLLALDCTVATWCCATTQLFFDRSNVSPARDW